MIEYARGQFWAVTDDQPPDELAYLWRWFQQLSDKRGVSVGMGGAVLNPVSHCEIEAWARLYKVDLAVWEVSLLSTLDTEFRAAYAQQQSQQSEGTSVQDAARDALDLQAAIAAKAERERKAREDD